jgi:hypothetical protein
MILQLGVAGVFLLSVIVALITLWKKSNTDREADRKEARERDAQAHAERERARQEFLQAIQQDRAEFVEAIERGRAEFFTEIRRLGDSNESQRVRAEQLLLQFQRENNVAVQAMHEKQHATATAVTSLVESLSRRLKDS